MIRSAAILFSIVGISSLYGHLIISNVDTFNVVTYHVPMVMFDSLAIFLLKRKHVEYITNPLILMLSMSIINHTFGAFLWAAYNEGYVYDLGKRTILCLEIVIFIVGIFESAITRRRVDSSWTSVPGVHVMEGDKCD